MRLSSGIVNVVDLLRFAVPEPLAQEVVQFLTANEDILDLDYNVLCGDLGHQLRALRKRAPEAFRARLNDLPEATMNTWVMRNE